MSAAARARIAARCSVSVAAHSGNARFAVATASSTSGTSALGTLATTSSVAGLTTSSSSCEAALRPSPPISMAASTVLPPSGSLEARIAPLARGGESLAMVVSLKQRGLGQALGDDRAALVGVGGQVQQPLGGGERQR